MRPRRLPTAPELTVRPIRPTDKGALLDLFERLTPRSRLRRFLAPKPSLSRRELAYFTEVDHRTHEALVAVDGDGVLHGVARYASGPGEATVADVAVAVAHAAQGRGLGTGVARPPFPHPRADGLRRLPAMTPPENRPPRQPLR